MEFSELVTLRRSCRAFGDAPVTEETLAALLEAGKWAPSPLNLQPFQFIAVRDPDLKDGIIRVGEAAKQQVLDRQGPGWVKNYSMAFIKHCPLILVVLYDPDKGGLGSYFNQPSGALQAASACIQNMLLKAEDLGLGSLWFTFFDPGDLKALLNIPETLEVAGTLLLGRPESRTKPPPRKPPVLHINRFQA